EIVGRELLDPRSRGDPVQTVIDALRVHAAHDDGPTTDRQEDRAGLAPTDPEPRLERVFRAVVEEHDALAVALADHLQSPLVVVAHVEVGDLFASCSTPVADRQECRIPFALGAW